LASLDATAANCEIDAMIVSMRTLMFRIAVVLAVVPLAGFVSLEALLAPKAELWPRWAAHDATSTVWIDHGDWTRFLRKYVKPDPAGLNRVDYRGVTPADRQALAGYIARLAALPVSRFSRPEQRAYWINLYNALTVDQVLTHYPLKSIRDISSGLFGSGPWDESLVKIEGEEVSLNDIEHRILRPIWKDPRIHYAVNCASVGCPNLLRSAFTAGAAETMLEQAAKAYVNSPRGTRIDGDGLTVSSIYVWFQDDFGGTDAGVIDHLRRYADAPLKERLAGRDSIDGHAYDWSLNEAEK
jgi:hypothetical protein